MKVKFDIKLSQDSWIEAVDYLAGGAPLFTASDKKKDDVISCEAEAQFYSGQREGRISARTEQDGAWTLYAVLEGDKVVLPIPSKADGGGATSAALAGKGS